MAKRFAVLVVVAAAMTAMTVPAFAQEAPAEAPSAAEAQYESEHVTSPETVQVTGEVVERGGWFYVENQTTGKEYYLTGSGNLFEPFQGEVATVYGTAECGVGICSLEVEKVEGLEQEATIVGEIVEIGGWQHLVDDATGTEYYLVGSFDSPEEADALTGKRVEAVGVTQCFTDGPEYGCQISFSSIEPIGEAAENVPAEETIPAEESVPAEETTVVKEKTVVAAETTAIDAEDAVSPEQAGIDVNEDGSVDEADGQHAVQVSDSAVAASEQGTLPATGSEGMVSSATKALPSTGGVLPIAGLAGLIAVAGGLLVRAKLAR